MELVDGNIQTAGAKRRSRSKTKSRRTSSRKTSSHKTSRKTSRKTSSRKGSRKPSSRKGSRKGSRKTSRKTSSRKGSRKRSRSTSRGILAGTRGWPTPSVSNMNTLKEVGGEIEMTRTVSGRRETRMLRYYPSDGRFYWVKKSQVRLMPRLTKRNNTSMKTKDLLLAWLWLANRRAQREASDVAAGLAPAPAAPDAPLSIQPTTPQTAAIAAAATEARSLANQADLATADAASAKERSDKTKNIRERIEEQNRIAPTDETRAALEAIRRQEREAQEESRRAEREAERLAREAQRKEEEARRRAEEAEREAQREREKREREAKQAIENHARYLRTTKFTTNNVGVCVHGVVNGEDNYERLFVYKGRTAYGEGGCDNIIIAGILSDPSLLLAFDHQVNPESTFGSDVCKMLIRGGGSPAAMMEVYNHVANLAGGKKVSLVIHYDHEYEGNGLIINMTVNGDDKTRVYAVPRYGPSVRTGTPVSGNIFYHNTNDIGTDQQFHVVAGGDEFWYKARRDLFSAFFLGADKIQNKPSFATCKNILETVKGDGTLIYIVVDGSRDTQRAVESALAQDDEELRRPMEEEAELRRTAVRADEDTDLDEDEEYSELPSDAESEEEEEEEEEDDLGPVLTRQGEQTSL